MILEEYLYAQYNWRLYAEFLHQLMVLPTCYTSDQVFYVGRVMLERFESVVSIYLIMVYDFQYVPQCFRIYFINSD